MANCWDLSPDGWNFSTTFSTSRFSSWYPSHTTDHLFFGVGWEPVRRKTGKPPASRCGLNSQLIFYAGGVHLCWA